jgi:hypothetical protein
MFIPSDIERKRVISTIPVDKNIIEGFGGSLTSGSYYISNAGHKEYLKVIRLTEEEYDSEFWKQSEVLKKVNQSLKSRLRANGEKVAETVPNSAGRPWWVRSFYEGEKLSPGYTGVEIYFEVGDLLRLWAEIA